MNKTMQSWGSKIKAVAERHLSCEAIPLSSVTSLIYPVLIDQALLALMNILNATMVSSAGPEAISAVNMVDSLNMFLINFFVAIATGGTVVVAQYCGRHDNDSAGRAAAQAILSSFMMAILTMTMILGFKKQILGFLFGSAEALVLENAAVYLTGCSISFPFFAIYQAGLGAMRGSGDSKSSMVLSVATNACYVVGNIIFINGMKLGVLGAAISIVLSRVIASILVWLYIAFVRRDLGITLKSFLHLDFTMLRSILYIGLPTAMEQVFFHGGRILTQTYIVGMGTSHIVANAIGASLSSIFYIPGNTMIIVAVTVVGQCMGMGDHVSAKKMLKSFVGLASIFSIVLAVLFGPFLPMMISLYNPSAESYSMALIILIISIIGLPTMWVFGFILPSGLRAAGDAAHVSIYSLLSMWFIRVVLGYILGVTLNMGVIGVWAAMTIEWGTRGLLFSMRIRGDKWYRHKVLK